MAFGPYDADFAWIRSWWSPVNVTAMTTCCAPANATEVGCFTYCPLNKDDNVDTDKGYDEWVNGFYDCLSTEGQKAVGGNQSYIAPQVTLQRSDFAAATSVRPAGLGLQGVLFLVLGALSWILA
ncbi:hypothetical protein F5Y18DRAFT_428148 [Xylariaceae sp. FL1019]|nr:hypothetical protein F5Y18DRAFT_428148 [Xylariaceae sp. FL1019]